MAEVKISPVTLVMGLGGVLILGVFSWLTFGPGPTAPPPPTLTQEAKDYRSNLAISNFRMQAAESYVNSRLIEILGDITNKGNRTVRLAEVTCVFLDYSNREVARERAVIVGGRAGSLAPGATRSFRLPFDTIPGTWNQATPMFVIAQIQFE